MTSWNDGTDPEDAAGEAAEWAYLRMLVKGMAKMTAGAVACLAVVAFDYALLMLALWRVPQWLAGFLAAFLAAEVIRIVAGYARSRKAVIARKAEQAGMTEHEVMAVTSDRLRTRMSEAPPLRWQMGPRSLKFWEWIVTRAVYSSCAGLVFSGWAGITGGVALAVAYTAALMTLGTGTVRSLRSVTMVALFSDPTPPRDSPEA